MVQPQYIHPALLVLILVKLKKVFDTNADDVYLNIKITSSQEEVLNLSASDEKRYREEYLGEVIK